MHAVQDEYQVSPWVEDEWQDRDGLSSFGTTWDDAESQIFSLNNTLPEPVRIPVRDIKTSIIITYSYCREPFDLKTAVAQWNDKESESYLEHIQRREWSLLEQERARSHSEPETSMGGGASADLPLATADRIRLTRQIDLVLEVRGQVQYEHQMSRRLEQSDPHHPFPREREKEIERGQEQSTGDALGGGASNSHESEESRRSTV